MSDEVLVWLLFKDGDGGEGQEERSLIEGQMSVFQ